MKNDGEARRREQLLRLVLTALLLYALGHYTAAQVRLARTEETAAALAEERAALEAEHTALERRLAEGESADALEERARRELGLMRPGEIVFYFRDGEEN